MSDLNYRHKSQACDISSSATPDFTLDQSAATVAIYCISTSSLTFTVSGTIDGTTWVNVPTWDESGAASPAGATLTASTSKIVYAATPGFTKIRCVRVAGSGTIAFASSLAAITGGGVSGIAGSTATGTVLASAARTATVQSSDIDGTGMKSLRLYLSTTAATSTPSITVQLVGKDPISGVYYYVTATPTAVTASGVNVAYDIGPACVTYAGSVVQATASPIPKTWAVVVTHADTDSITYSISYEATY